ncbi:MAG TPA: hypothetical protein VFR12_04120, partial [Pyrinomonadaceae bacterium]|nr:hypothetical protein [Pyrinomonadaceae bacterium]
IHRSHTSHGRRWSSVNGATVSSWGHSVLLGEGVAAARPNVYGLESQAHCRAPEERHVLHNMGLLTESRALDC